MEAVLCSISAAGKMLGIGRSKTYQLLAADNSLETITIGRRRLVKVESIHRFVENSGKAEAA